MAITPCLTYFVNKPGFFITENGAIIYKNGEYTYCQVLEAVSNPLGQPDTRRGLSPPELADCVRDIFGIDEDTHRRCMRAVQHPKPNSVSLCVTVLESKDLKPYGANAQQCDPYCVLQVRPPKGSTPKNSPRGSPKSSPWGSPRTSPTGVRRHSSLRGNEASLGLRETHVVKGTVNPKWNSQMEIDVADLQTDVLHLSVWDENLLPAVTQEGGDSPAAHSNQGAHSNQTGQGKQAAQGSHTSPHRHSIPKKNSLRNLFRHFNHRLSADKAEGCLGHVKIDLKDLPVSGVERWYDLYEDSRQRRRTQGQVRVGLQLRTRQSRDSAESDQCSVEDFCQITHKVYQHAANTMVLDTEQYEEIPVLCELPLQSQMILDQFAIQNHFSELSKKVIELSVQLEARCQSHSVYTIAEPYLRATINIVSAAYSRRQRLTSSLEDQGAAARVGDVLGQSELVMFEQATAQYLDHVSEAIKDDHRFPRLFPHTEIQVEELKQQIGISKQLLSLSNKLSKNDFGEKFSSIIRDKIQADCCAWWEQKERCIRSCSTDAALSETKILSGVVREVITYTKPSLALSQYFMDLKVKYEKCVTICLEKKVAAKAQALMLRIDDYQKRFLRYRSNIMKSSQVAQTLYGVLREYDGIIKTHFTMRDLYRITMTGYQEWFRQTVTYWLQTFREEGIRRVVKALQIEKDVVQVTESVKYSNSAVDVESIFHKICKEWESIDFVDADIALLGATKISELICDGVKRYLKKVEDILECNGYYDFIDNEQFDVTDQLCITLNNMVHVIGFLRRLPVLLRWEAVCQGLAVKHEDPAVGQRCLTTLQRLTTSATDDGLAHANVLLSRITRLMEVDLHTYTRKFTQGQPNKPSSVDELLVYLRTNLAVVHQKLDKKLMPAVIRDLWTCTLDVFSQSLMDGEHPDYYMRMNHHLASLHDYFQDVGLAGFVKECSFYTRLVERLALNMQPSETLMLQYFSSVCEPPVTSPLGYYGYLEVKVAYQVEATHKAAGDADKTLDTNANQPDEVVTLFVNVLRARQLPAMNKSGDATNPFVTLSLCPVNHFHFDRNLKTPTVKNTLDPTFDVTYQYQGVPLSRLQTPGAALVLTLWHSDPLLPCHYFLGEVCMPLYSGCPRLGSLQVIDDIPATICPLRQQDTSEHGPFKVLEQRQKWDKPAREMVTQRRRDTGMTPAWPMCQPLTYVLNKVAGPRSEVKAQPKLSGPQLYHR